jgi:hemerythrin superfamily protein
MKAEAKDSEKGALVARICEELTIHADMEEEIFYPAVRAAIDAEERPRGVTADLKCS